MKFLERETMPGSVLAPVSELYEIGAEFEEIRATAKAMVKAHDQRVEESRKVAREQFGLSENEIEHLYPRLVQPDFGGVFDLFEPDKNAGKGSPPRCIIGKHGLCST
jgi:hypothetical protein